MCSRRARRRTLPEVVRGSAAGNSLDELIGAGRIFFAGDPPAMGRALRDLHQHGAVRDDRDVTGADPMLICYTSGTTGKPKGAVLTHANLEAVAAGAIAFDALTRDDRAIITVPLAFTGASVSVAIPFLRAGGSLVLRDAPLPRSMSGKILKREIRSELKGGSQ